METLNQEWGICFQLALEGIAAGSFGISVIVTNASGEIISRGRNQLYDSYDSCNIVRNTLVSHAELNAIAGIPIPYREDTNLALYATVEPCPMCLGAVVMSNIKKVKIASRDPWAGSIRLLSKDWYLNHKGIKHEYETGFVEEVFFLLSLYSLQKDLEERNKKDHPVLQKLQSLYPEYYYHSNFLFHDKEFITALTTRNGPAVIQKIQALKDISIPTKKLHNKLLYFVFHNTAKQELFDGSN